MISRAIDKKIRIHITTYKNTKPKQVNMETNTKKPSKCNKFVCAICLNTHDDHSKKNTHLCRACQKCANNCQNIDKRIKERQSKESTKDPVKDPIKDPTKYPAKDPIKDAIKYTAKDSIKDPTKYPAKDPTKYPTKDPAKDATKYPTKDPAKDPNEKNVQTSDSSVQGFNLLNEVLTVFQNKRTDNKEKLVLKDIAVSTEDLNNPNKSKNCKRLVVTTFHYSIDDTKPSENGRFTIVSSRQPEFIRKSQYSIDLSKNKSSSVPQMKMDELKYLLREKVTSNDAIEEVNRMFATVRKSYKNFDSENRPAVRNGPRVLPVVKTLACQEIKKMNIESMEKLDSRCYQPCMPCGDSCLNSQCCKELGYDSSNNKCVYMMCCHYQNRLKMQTGMLICEKCKNANKGYHNFEHENIKEGCC